jgi:hypothetical protein
LQSYTDEFDLPEGENPRTPATPGGVLRRGDPKDNISDTEQSTYRSGVGKLLHMMKWTRPEIQNAVRELSRYMAGATRAHMNEMYRAMRYCVTTPKRGLLLKPDKEWDGDPNFEFEVLGRSDSDFAKDPETRRSVSGYSTFLNKAPITMKSKMQTCVTLDVTSAELVSATQCAQDMLFIMRVLESIELKVKKPMRLEVDNTGAVDLSHNWSVSGRTRHDSIRQSFLRELNEDGIIEVFWIETSKNSSDIFTKNLSGPVFEKHTSTYCGRDEYMNSDDSQGEGVGGEEKEIANDVIDDLGHVESHQSDTMTERNDEISGLQYRRKVITIDENRGVNHSISHRKIPEKRRKLVRWSVIERA